MDTMAIGYEISVDPIAVGRLAIACKGWEWMPGMKAISVRYGDLENVVQRVPDDMRLWRPYSEEAVPDLTDPATLGCLVDLVRRLFNDPRANLWTRGDLWEVFVIRDGLGSCKTYGGKTEAQALVAALEAA
jgi:hypothetical protein